MSDIESALVGLLEARNDEIDALRDHIERLEARAEEYQGERDALRKDAERLPDLLWVELMDWCRFKGVAPAYNNELFAIVEKFRNRIANEVKLI